MAYVGSIPCSGPPVGGPGVPAGLQALGCAACGGKCGMGLGLFDSGLDFSQWGIAEWTAIGLGTYLLFSVAGDTRRATDTVRATVRRRRRKAAAEA